jgi:type IV pilus assembly protein PilP
MINIRRVVVLVLPLLLLAACGGDGMDDLREFMRTAHADKKPKVEPLPEIKPAESYQYSASAMPDPFSSVNLRPTLAAQKGSGPRPDPNRRREPLEDYPLDSLKMVGTLSRGSQVWAVISAPDGTVHRVQQGNYLGQNFGRIRGITEDKVDIIELTQTTIGDWVQREANLAIEE